MIRMWIFLSFDRTHSLTHLYLCLIKSIDFFVFLFQNFPLDLIET